MKQNVKLHDNQKLAKDFFLSYLRFFIIIVAAVVTIAAVSFFSTKKALTQLGETALKNRIQMGLAMMDSLQNQVEKGSITREDAEEAFRSEMLNPKQSDGKTRGENAKLELNIKAYMYAINSKGIEEMHPYKEGEDISKFTDPKGDNVVKLIIDEGNNPKNDGIIHFGWKNPGEKFEKPKVNAVGYFKPWDWYINVGCYDKDFYAPAYKILGYMIVISVIIIIISFLLIKSLMARKINPLSSIVNSMEMASEGNMAVKADIKNKDEIGYIGEVFNKMSGEIRNILLKIKDISGVIDEKSLEIKASTAATSESSNNIKGAMEEVSDAINNSAKDMQNSLDSMQHLSENINSVKENSIVMENQATQANELNSNIVNILNNLEQKNQENMAVSKITNKNIQELLGKSQAIVGIVSTIEEISNQINLLSLNAAIESARAGEAGRGFAVVSEQIKELSNETTEAVKQINALIGELIKVINNSVSSVEKSQKTTESQMETINNTKEILKKVINFMEKMPQVIEQNVVKIENIYKNKDVVETSMDSVLSVIEEISASSEEITASTSEVNEKMDNIKELAEELKGFSKELNDRLDKFSL